MKALAQFFISLISDTSTLRSPCPPLRDSNLTPLLQYNKRSIIFLNLYGDIYYVQTYIKQDVALTLYDHSGIL
jgi:hypothetical protein